MGAEKLLFCGRQGHRPGLWHRLVARNRWPDRLRTVLFEKAQRRELSMKARNVDFQSAVTLIGSRRRVRSVLGTSKLSYFADCKSAIQQSASLRYIRKAFLSFILLVALSP